MKHVHPDKLIECYNVCRVGGDDFFYCIDLSNNNKSKEAESFIKDFKSHGYDIITPEDFHFTKRVEEFNKVSLHCSRVWGSECYRKYTFEEMCICGDWMFTRRHDGYNEEWTEIPKQGGRRAGAGAKSKHNLMGGTAVIRVPGYQKKQIKEFVDFLIETEQSDGVSLGLAISMGISALKGKKSVWEEQGLQDLAAHEQKYIECLQQLYDKLPRGFVSKTSEEEKRDSVL